MHSVLVVLNCKTNTTLVMKTVICSTNVHPEINYVTALPCIEWTLLEFDVRATVCRSILVVTFSQADDWMKSDCWEGEGVNHRQLPIENREIEKHYRRKGD